MAEPIVATYSIAACDLAAGHWGVATQSKFLAVGSVVPVGRARRRRGRDPGLRQPTLRAGRTRAPARRRDRPRRPSRSSPQPTRAATTRQLGVVDAHGGSATFTGAGCIDWAGGRTGPCFAAQGNILVGEETVAALADDVRRDRGPPARATADRLPRRRAGGRRRPARPAVGCAPGRRARRRLRRAQRRPRRPARRRPPAADRGARAASTACRTCCSARRRATSGSSRRNAGRRAERAPGAARLRRRARRRRSPRGRAPRISKNGSTVSIRSTPSCCESYARSEQRRLPRSSRSTTSTGCRRRRERRSCGPCAGASASSRSG